MPEKYSIREAEEAKQMSYGHPRATTHPGVEAAVTAAFSNLGIQDIVSTRAALALARKVLGETAVSDDEIVTRIVSMATGRTMPVVFDHR